MLGLIIRKYLAASLAVKLTLSVVLVLLIPLLTASVFFSVQIYKGEIEKVNDKAIKDLDSISSYVDNNYLNAMSILNIIRQNQMLKNFISRDDDVPLEDVLEFKNNFVRTFENILYSQRYTEYIRVYYDNKTIPEMSPIFYYKDRVKDAAWFSNIESMLSFVNINFDNDGGPSISDSPKKLIGFYSKINNLDNSTFAVAEVSYSMKDFFGSWFETTENGIVLFLYNDQLFYNNDTFDWNAVIDDNAALLIDIASLENSNNITLGSKDYCVHVRDGFIRGSYFIKLDRIDSISHSLWIQIILINIVALLSLFVLYIVVRLIVRFNIKRIYSLNNAMNMVKEGNFTVKVSDDNKDEIGELGFHFNDMTEKLSVLIEQNKTRILLEKEAELKALQNQINSHFIYNVLENIKMMAEIRYELDISDALTSLASLLRYSMRWTTQFVSLEEELDYVRNYMALVNLRYNFIIQLVVQVEDEHLKRRIPKMSLQPIIENSVIHGIESVAENAVIRVNCFYDGERFVIEITDNGTGLSPQRLLLLNNVIRGNTIIPQNSKSNGIGLRNVQERIELYYGKDFGIEIISQEGLFTKVRVILPMED